MNAIVNIGPNQLAWQDRPNSDPGPGQVRIRTAACGICGTDLEMIRGWSRTTFPCVPGHEWSGTVDALGPGVPEALARTAALLRADADALDAWAEEVADAGDVHLLASLPAAVRTRVLRRAAITAGAPAGALTGGHVAAIDALVTGWHGQGPVNLPGGLVAHRAYDRLSFR